MAVEDGTLREAQVRWRSDSGRRNFFACALAPVFSEVLCTLAHFCHTNPADRVFSIS
jgi:hypothetical protein